MSEESHSKLNTRPSSQTISDSMGDKLRILLVDDEPDVTLVLKMGLEQYGFEVTAFNDPAKALAHYKPGQYDLLLLDIRMPGMNGFELYKKIHEIDDKVKICFLTAFEIYYDEFRRMFPNIRVKCFARKPITPSQLRQVIYDELEIKSMDR